MPRIRWCLVRVRYLHLHLHLHAYRSTWDAPRPRDGRVDEVRIMLTQGSLTVSVNERTRNKHGVGSAAVRSVCLCTCFLFWTRPDVVPYTLPLDV